VPGDGIAAPSDLAAEAAPAYEVAAPEPERPESSESPGKPERVAVTSDAADSSSYKTFDVPTTRRRPVVFEEDDDLDVPDFLK
jgi:cell division protein FtsZ